MPGGVRTTVFRKRWFTALISTRSVPSSDACIASPNPVMLRINPSPRRMRLPERALALALEGWERNRARSVPHDPFHAVHGARVREDAAGKVLEVLPEREVLPSDEQVDGDDPH